MKKLEKLMAEYGVVALVIHYLIFFLCLGFFVSLLEAGVFQDVVDRMGWSIEADSTGGFWAMMGVAYGATKIVQPFRIALTLLLTPFVGRAVKRWWSKRQRTGPSPETPSTPNSEGQS